MDHNSSRINEEEAAALAELLPDSHPLYSRLLLCIAAQEREPELQRRMEELREENEHLKRELKKLRLKSIGDHASSRLRDALRE